MNWSDPSWWQARKVNSKERPGLVPSQDLEERRQCFVAQQNGLPTQASCCGTGVRIVCVLILVRSTHVGKVIPPPSAKSGSGAPTHPRFLLGPQSKGGLSFNKWTPGWVLRGRPTTVSFLFSSGDLLCVRACSLPPSPLPHDIASISIEQTVACGRVIHMSTSSSFSHTLASFSFQGRREKRKYEYHVRRNLVIKGQKYIFLKMFSRVCVFSLVGL